MIIKKKYSIIKQIVSESDCTIIFDCINQSLLFWKNYFIHHHNAIKINKNINVITKEAFFAPYFDLLSTKELFQMLYDVLIEHKIEPKIGLIYETCILKKNKLSEEIYINFTNKIKESKKISAESLGLNDVDYVFKQNSEKNYIYIFQD